MFNRSTIKKCMARSRMWKLSSCTCLTTARSLNGKGGMRRRTGEMRTLLVDNYDSYTYNLYQLMMEIHQREPIVVLNDALSIDEIQALIRKEGIDAIVISPGPGHPNNPKDTGICPELFRKLPDVPILGVCLGHQILASVHGARIDRTQPIHGRLSGIVHDGHPLFDYIPSSPTEFQVVRYHSLAVNEASLPSCLRSIAWTCGGTRTLNGHRWQNESDSVVMALKHRGHRHYGVQFHPESIGSTFGGQLLANFQSLAMEQQHSGDVYLPSIQRNGAVAEEVANIEVIWKKLNGVHYREADLDGLFDLLYKGEGNWEDTFWLDSTATEGCRFSFMGGPGGSLWRKLIYHLSSEDGGCLMTTDRWGHMTTTFGSIWDVLEKELLHKRTKPDPRLPFDFCGGFLGYLGYELKALCGGRLKHKASTPDAALFFADRIVVIDHQQNDIYCLSLHSHTEPRHAIESHQWIQDTSQIILSFLSASNSPHPLQCTHSHGSLVLDRNQDVYEADVETCQNFLRSGDSYELCLTNKFRGKRQSSNERELYRHLRRCNLAPYAAWLKFSPSLSICCSSPERLLKGDRHRGLEAKPIKGTIARGIDRESDERAAAWLKASEKNQAENLMIVDLLRNDLGRVCEPSTVHVPSLMAVER